MKIYNEQEIRNDYHKLTETLREKNISITTMESCTSGLIASNITDYEGASAILRGSSITYSNEAKIAAGVSYILDHWREPTLTVSDAAQQANMSEVYFRKLFRAEYGVAPKQYIINLRMQNAVSMLNTNDYALQEVAEQSGYADYKHFSVEFKRIKGCSPSDYRYHFWD
mgnify:CR=1 FL=1